ncbi:MAG: lysylphosphatidylglycerol synthase transmembrane domain-containing protein [Candidatus Omnitrophota bacterium]
MKKSKVFPIIKLFISTGLITVLIIMMRTKLGQIFITLKTANIILLIAGYILYAVGTISLCSMRLKWIFFVHGISLTLWQVIGMVYIGQFFNNFMPSTIGGDVYKIYIAARHSPKMMNAVSAVAIDRLIGLFSMVLLAVFALFCGVKHIENQAVILVIGGLFAASLIFFIFLYTKKLAKKFSFLLKIFRPLHLDQKIKDFYHLAYEFKIHRKLIIDSIAVSIILQLLSIGMVYMFALSIGINLSFKIFILLMPVIMVVSQLPSLNGLGIREGAFVYFFKPFIYPESALALSLLFLGAMMFSSIIGGVVYALTGQVNTEEIKKYSQQ